MMYYARRLFLLGAALVMGAAPASQPSNDALRTWYLQLADRDPLDAGSAVHGWVANQLLRREAEALIKGPDQSPPAPTSDATHFILPQVNDDALPRVDQSGGEP